MYIILKHDNDKTYRIYMQMLLLMKSKLAIKTKYTVNKVYTVLVVVN